MKICNLAFSDFRIATLLEDLFFFCYNVIICVIKNVAPVPAPRKKRKEKIEEMEEDEDSTEKEAEEDLNLTVKERIQKLQNKVEDGEEKVDTISGRPKRVRPVSQAFNMFEEKGVIISMVSAYLVFFFKLIYLKSAV